MKFSRVANAGIALALAGTMFSAASAQESSDSDVQLAQPAPTVAVTNTAEATFGGYVFELPADEPLVACVIARSSDLSGEDALSYRVFIREDTGAFSSAGVYQSVAIGALANANAGDCTSLEGFNDAE